MQCHVEGKEAGVACERKLCEL